MSLIDELMQFLSQDKKQLHNYQADRPVQWLDDGEAQAPNPMMELNGIAPKGAEVAQATDGERAPINKAPAAPPDEWDPVMPPEQQAVPQHLKGGGRTKWRISEGSPGDDSYESAGNGIYFQRPTDPADEEDFQKALQDAVKNGVWGGAMR
jgi:hypothetical protein